jgi:hypothetical protein
MRLDDQQIRSSTADLQWHFTFPVDAFFSGMWIISELHC